MKLAIFGASGATGRHLVQQALARQHEVKVLIRHVDSLPDQHERLTRVVGSLDNPLVVQSVIEGADAVISVLGARKGEAQTVCSDGIRSILVAMQTSNVHRLIALSAFGAGETHDASMFIRFVRTVISEKMRDKDEMEKSVKASAVDWTLVRPPRLTNGEASGQYRADMTLKPGISGSISRADLAGFILQAAEKSSFIHQAPIVANIYSCRKAGANLQK